MTVRKPRYIEAIKNGDLGIPPPYEAPDVMEVAAWLDGRLSERQAAVVEAALCHDTPLRRALLALDEAPPQPLPATELVRAKALAGPGLLVPPFAGPQRRFQWLAHPVSVGALACSLVVSGFALGSGFATDLFARRALVMAQLLSDLLPL